MKVFESEIYAQNGIGCLPFKIVIEEGFVQDKRRLEVKRIEYVTMEGKTVKSECPMFVAGWTE